MKRLAEKYVNEDIITYLLMVFMAAFPIIELICEIAGHTYELQNELLMTEGIILFVMFWIRLFTRDKLSLRITDILLMLSMLFVILSIIFSHDKYISVYGADHYYREGPFQYLGYFMVFFAATMVSKYENKRKIFLSLAIVMGLHIVAGIIQHIDVSLWPFDPFCDDEWFWDIPESYGLAQHSNFFIPIPVMSAMATGCLYVTSNKKNTDFFLIISLICFAVAMFTSARTAWVGLLCGTLFIICFELFLKKTGGQSIISYKKLITLVTCFVIIFILELMFDPCMREQIEETKTELKEMNKDTIGSNRGTIWRVGLRAFLDRPLFGIGFDNYGEAFFMHPEMTTGFYNYKGHNEYLHVLVTQGIFAAVNYIAFCFIVWWKGIRNYLDAEDRNDKVITYMLLAMVMGYFSQAFFNSSVTNIAVYKWLVMGLLVPRAKQRVIIQA